MAEEDVEQVKAEICRLICTRFIESGQGTKRKSLNVRFRRPDLLNELVSRNVLEWPRSGEEFYPKLATFVVAGDAKLLDYVRSRIVVAVEAMKQLYLSDEEERAMHSWESFVAQARKINEQVDDGFLRLAFHFIRELGLHGGYQPDEKSGIRTFSVSESVLTIGDPNVWIDEQIARVTPRPQPQVQNAWTPGPGFLDENGLGVQPAQAAMPAIDLSFIRNVDLRRL